MIIHKRNDHLIYILQRFESDNRVRLSSLITMIIYIFLPNQIQIHIFFNIIQIELPSRIELQNFYKFKFEIGDHQTHCSLTWSPLFPQRYQFNNYLLITFRQIRQTTGLLLLTPSPPSILILNDPTNLWKSFFSNTRIKLE